MDSKLATKQDLKDLENRILIKLGSLVAVATVTIIGVLGLLIQIHH